MVKNIKLIVVLVAGVSLFFSPLSLNQTNAACSKYKFKWDFYQTDAIYKGSIESIEKHELFPGSTGSGDGTAFFKMNLKISQKINGPGEVGDLVIIHEDLDENGHLYTNINDQIKRINADIGDEIFVKAQFDEDNKLDLVQHIQCDASHFKLMNLNSQGGDLPSEMSDEINQFMNGAKINEINGNVFEDYVYLNFIEGVDVGRDYRRSSVNNIDVMPTFNLDEDITRGEFLSMLARGLDFDLLEEEYFITLDNLSSFDDIRRYDHYIKDQFEQGYDFPPYTASAIEQFYQKDLVSGYADGEFKPTQTITRAEASKIVINAMDYKGMIDSNGDFSNNFPDVDESNKFYQYISILNTLEVDGEKIVSGYTDGEFKPEENITRGQANKIVYLVRNY